LILKHILILLILFDFVVSSVTVPGHLYSFPCCMWSCESNYQHQSNLPYCTY